MDNIQEAINWFDAEIKAQESGYAFALASGKERDEHFENWLDIMRAALVALRNEHRRVRGCEYCNVAKSEDKVVDINYCPMCGRRLEVEP